MSRILITFFLVLIHTVLTIPQEKEFDEALGLYQAGKLNDALDGFRDIVNDFGLNSRTYPSRFFIAKILMDQEKYLQAEREINNFLEKYSTGKYSEDFLYLKVKLQIDQFRYEEGFRNSLDLIQKSIESGNVAESKALSGNIALGHLSARQIKSVSDETKDRMLKPFILLLLGKKYHLEGDDVNAIRSFNEITSSYASAVENTEAEYLKKNLTLNSLQRNKGALIGVMLPLSDEQGKPNISGQEILEGIKYAVSEYNKQRENKIGIVVRDTKRNEANIKAIKEEFVDNPSIRCVVGPIFSDEVRTALNEFKDADLPMISPTATDEDLTNLSQNFFQANPPFSLRGRIFAQYLFYVENKKRMAILNAIDGYSPLLAANFRDEFEKLGGKIVVRESYRSSSFSVSDQIKNISAYASDIEGIYIPLTDKLDATAILSQLVQSNLNVPLYGNQDWMLVKGFETSPELSNKLTFTSDYYIDFNDDMFRNFTNDFQSVTGREVNRNNLYGYDTAKYLLTVMRNIDPSRKAIKLKMESGLSSAGFKNNISFDQSRMNKFLNIVRYNDGIFLLVDKFRAGR